MEQFPAASVALNGQLVGFSNVYGVPGIGPDATYRQRPETEPGAVIDGKAVAAELRDEVAEDVAALAAANSPPPGLATVLVGADPASEVYVAAKHHACAEVGMRSIDHRLASDCSQGRLLALVDELNENPAVNGILVQLPLPEGLDASAVIDRIDAAKDVDGLSTASVGSLWRGRDALVPCTPAGVIELLRRSRLPIEGARAVIVGRSELVGKPLAGLLLAANATVTVCHSRTQDLVQVCSEADLLIAALGRPRAIGADHVKRGAVVVDVGINRTAEGLVGDVDLEAVRPRVAAITPVPGGVGPMTIACLLQNTLAAYRLQRGGEGLV